MALGWSPGWLLSVAPGWFPGWLPTGRPGRPPRCLLFACFLALLVGPLGAASPLAGRGQVRTLQGSVRYLLGRSGRLVGKGTITLLLQTGSEPGRGTGRYEELSERPRTHTSRRPCRDFLLGSQQVVQRTRIRPYRSRGEITWEELPGGGLLLRGVPLELRGGPGEIRLRPGSPPVGLETSPGGTDAGLDASAPDSWTLELRLPRSRWLPPGRYLGSCGRGPGWSPSRGRLPLRVLWELVDGGAPVEGEAPAAEAPLPTQ